MTATAPDRPTVVVSRRVRPGRETAFAAWERGFMEAVSRFPGYVGHQSVPPVGTEQPDWVFVFTFDTAEHLRAWIDSDVRRDWLAQAIPLVEGEERAQVISGLEALFGLLSPDRAQPPAVWKLALATFAGLWPTAYLNARLLGPHLAHLGTGLRSLLVSALTVAEMTWIVMPLVTRLLRPWIQPRKR